MKRKLLVFIIALAMIISLVPMSVQAAGTGDGTSAENAFVVTDFASLQSALSNPALSFIETSGYIEFDDSVLVPNGKTLIIQPVSGVEYAFSMGMYLYDDSFVIEEGGTVINNGGIKYTANLRMVTSGSLINYARISGVCIDVEDTGTLTNASGAIIDERSAILFYSGSILNSGTISCLINQIGTDAECLFSGIDASMIRQTNAPVDYSDMPFKTLNLSENDTTTVGMTGDNSTLVFAPDDWLVFAMGYKVELEEGQTIVVQQSSDFRPYLYLVQANGSYSYNNGSSFGGLRYTATDAETITIVAGGYDTFDIGSLKVTVYDPVENSNDGLDFTDPAVPSSGEGWTWDSASKTLTLSGLMLAAEGTNGVTLPDGSTIVLTEGSENFIQTKHGEQEYAALGVSPHYAMDGVYCIGSLTITGSGSLTVNGEQRGLTCNGILTINDQGALYFGGDGSEGIFAEEGIVIEDCPDLSAFGYFSGIGSGGVIRIMNSSIVAYGWNFGISTGPFYRIETEYVGGNIEITNSRVDASCDLSSESLAAIYAGDNNYDPDSGVHSKIIINDGGILSPVSGFVCNVNIINEPRCQTITSVGELAEITAWDQTSKSVLIVPAVELTYDMNGGSGTMEDSSSPYLMSEDVTILFNEFTRTGFTFTGWNTAADGSGTSYEPEETFTINEDTTLFAVWEINTFTVTFADWNGTVLNTQTVEYGDAAAAPASPSRTGYSFSAWDSDFSMITSDLTVTALYTLIPTPTPTSTPTPPTAVIAVKTGETGTSGTAAAILTVSAIGIFAVQFILRKKTQE